MLVKRTPPSRLSAALVSCAIALAPGQLRDVDGRPTNLLAPAAAANVLLFVASDCPISNGYAPEIQALCREYGGKGVSCSLIYEDPGIDAASVRAHRDAYRYGGAIPAVIDRDGAIARKLGASVTPEAVVVGADGKARYRGRIDNRYAALGQPRQVATVHDLRDALEAVAGGRPVARAETEALGCFITHAKAKDEP